MRGLLKIDITYKELPVKAIINKSMLKPSTDRRRNWARSRAKDQFTFTIRQSRFVGSSHSSKSEAVDSSDTALYTARLKLGR